MQSQIVRLISLALRQMQTQKDNIASHVGGEDVFHRDIAAGIDQASHECQAIERAMKEAFAFRDGFHQVSISELIACPKRPVVQIVAGLCFLKKTARIEDSVVSLEPQVTIRLPSDLGARSVPNKSGSVAIRSSD